jgi:hypothetical protein
MNECDGGPINGSAVQTRGSPPVSACASSSPQEAKRRAVAKADQHRLQCLLLLWRRATQRSRKGKERNALASTW